MSNVSPLPQRPRGDSSPGLLMDEMQDIERELDTMRNEWSAAEGDLVRRGTQVERLAAPKRLQLKKAPPAHVPKPTKEDLDALVLDWLWNEHSELMEAQLAAEATCAGFKVVFKCADRSLSSKQSRLSTEREAASRS